MCVGGKGCGEGGGWARESAKRTQGACSKGARALIPGGSLVTVTSGLFQDLTLSGQKVKNTKREGTLEHLKRHMQERKSTLEVRIRGVGHGEAGVASGTQS